MMLSFTFPSSTRAPAHASSSPAKKAPAHAVVRRAARPRKRSLVVGVGIVVGGLAMLRVYRYAAKPLLRALADPSARK